MIVPELDTIRMGKRSHISPNTISVPSWIFLIVTSFIILVYNCGTTLLANLAYLPPTLYQRAYDDLTLEGTGANILFRMFIIYPPRLFIDILYSLFIGGVAGALSGLLIAKLFSSTKTDNRLLGTLMGSISGMAICTSILPLHERLFLAKVAAEFFYLYDLGGIHTIQIGCQYGAYALALIHSSYLQILFLIILLAIAAPIFRRIAVIAISPIMTKNREKQATPRSSLKASSDFFPTQSMRHRRLAKHPR